MCFKFQLLYYYTAQFKYQCHSLEISSPVNWEGRPSADYIQNLIEMYPENGDTNYFKDEKCHYLFLVKKVDKLKQNAPQSLISKNYTKPNEKS